MLSLLWAFTVLGGLDRVLSFDVTRNDNLAVYWGQNSYGATHSDTANFQKTLSFYCQDNSVDIFPLAFLDQFFGTGGLPHLDLSNICSSNTNPVFSGTNLVNCQFLASDIQTCQSKGKIVTLSMGGGAAGGVGFTSAAQASTFADTIWNLFLGGSSTTRPFGNAVLDGIDLDIEGGGTQFFDSFINRLRTHTNGASKKYYISGAPQCPFPDAYMGSVLNAVAFDMVFVQFYNNYCGLTNYNLSQDWDFGVWDNWAKTTAVNKNTKIFIGGPAAPSAAGSGYVAVNTLGTIAQQTRASYSSFGGIMLWDESQAYANNRFDANIKSILTNGGVAVPPVSTTSKPPTTTTPPTTSKTTAPPTTTSKPPTTGSCAGVAAWSSSIAYNGGAEVVYNGHLWTAKWWSQADTPGGPADDWTDNGACTSFDAAFTAPAANATPVVHTSPDVITKDSKSAAKVTDSAEASIAITPSQAANTAKARLGPDSIVSASEAEETSPRHHARSFQM